MASYRRYILAFLSIAMTVVVADVGEFYYPSSNLSFDALDTIEITYTTDFASPTLIYFCRNVTTGDIIIGMRFNYPK